MQRTTAKTLILCALSVSLMGCSGASALLNGKATVPQANNVPVGNNLTMPPDLQLSQPTATSDAYQPNGYVAPVAQPAPGANANQMASAAPPAAGGNLYGNAPAAPVRSGDIFDQAGISKVKPDGTKKNAAELNKELSAYYMAKKRAANPSYGTVGNIGAIFN